MPIYLYQHPKTNKVVEIVQRMHEEHIYVKDDVKWNRVFTKPQDARDTKVSSTDSHDFVKKTREKNYSIGDMWDMSAELSEKRGGVTGKDEMRVKAEESYKKKTGKSHPHAQAKKQKRFVI